MSEAVIAATPAPAPVVVPTGVPAVVVAAQPVVAPTVTPGDPAKAIEAPKGAPEKYADFVMPEGVTADSAILAGFSEIAKAQNLTQEDAQKFVDFHNNSVKAMIDGHAAQVAAWPAEIAKDAELGGADSPAKIATAQRAIAKFGTPALKTMLDTYGFGNHPEFVRFAYKVGSAIKEDSVSGTHGATAETAGPWTAKDFYDKAQKPNTKTAQ